jgi:transposase
MPAAIPVSQRRAIIESRAAGESFVSIAQRLGISYDTVRRIHKRYRATGQLAPNYEACGHREVRKAGAIYEQAIALKAAHPKWGAGLIRTELADGFAETHLPSERTLQRWFKRAGVQKPPQDRGPRQVVKRGKAAHEVWALDAKEEVQLADGSYVSWLTVVDEGSGAILATVLFPPQTLDEGGSAAGEGGAASHHAAMGTPPTTTHG